MSEASVTVTGYVGTTPELHLSANQVPWTSFRVASTRRVREPGTGEWRDGATTWFTVKAFRAAARTVSESLVQGQPVVVVGRLSTDEWTDRDGRERSSLVVEADAVGPDATRGVTRFARARVEAPAADPAGTGADGAHGAGSDPWAGRQPAGTTDDPWAVEPAGVDAPAGGGHDRARHGSPDGDPDGGRDDDGDASGGGTTGRAPTGVLIDA